MAYLTKSQARTAFRTLRRASASLDLRRSAQASPDREFDVFLSHSIQDAEAIAGIKALMEEVGLSVYVDWIDDAQLNRERVTKDTASRLRARMRKCKSLVYVASNASPRSKWMPWELGFFDGRRPGHVAILPLVDTPTETFRGQEYLSLYPYVESLPEIAGVRRLGIKRSSGSHLRIQSLPTIPVSR